MSWIIFTISGAFFQNLRSSLQKKLNKDLSTVASTYVRFAFALPFAILIFFLNFGNFEIISKILKQTDFIYLTIIASIFRYCLLLLCSTFLIFQILLSEHL